MRNGLLTCPGTSTARADSRSRYAADRAFCRLVWWRAPLAGAAGGNGCPSGDVLQTRVEPRAGGCARRVRPCRSADREARLERALVEPARLAAVSRPAYSSGPVRRDIGFMAIVLRGPAGIAGYARRPVGRCRYREPASGRQSGWYRRPWRRSGENPSRSASACRREVTLVLPPGCLSVSILPPCTLPSRGSSSRRRFREARSDRRSRAGF